MNASERALQAAKEAAEKEMADVAALEVGLAAFENKAIDYMAHHELPDLIWDVGNARAIWQGSFCREENGKVYFINPEGRLSSTTAANFINLDATNVFGPLINPEGIENNVAEMVQRNIQEDTAREIMSSCAKRIQSEFISHMRIYRQVELLDFDIDMFTEKYSISVRDKTAYIVFPFKPLVAGYPDNPAHLAKYKEFFAELDDLLDFVAAARFAATRRNCFIWVHAISDWGKGFLIQVFRMLGLVFDLNTSEIEKALKGEPVGIDPNEALTAWVMVHDELKSVSSAMKELNDSITISPKNKPRCRAKLYTKLFFSAEHVRSLIDEGVEQQFDRRFNYLRPENHDKRFDDLLAHPGQNLEFCWSVANYVAGFLNKLAAEYISLGVVGANNKAMEVIKKYHESHLLSAEFGLLDDRLPEMIADLRDKVLAAGEWNIECALPRGQDKDGRPLPVPQPPGVLRGLSKVFLDKLVANVKLCEVKHPNTKEYVEAFLIKNNDAIIDAYINDAVVQRLVGKVSYKAHQIADGLRDVQKQKENRTYVRWIGDEKVIRERGVVVLRNF